MVQVFKKQFAPRNIDVWVDTDFAGVHEDKEINQWRDSLVRELSYQGMAQHSEVCSTIFRGG